MDVVRTFALSVGQSQRLADEVSDRHRGQEKVLFAAYAPAGFLAFLCVVIVVAIGASVAVPLGH